MSSDGDRGKPNPLEDVRKGLGLLFRAARTTVERMQGGKLEEVVVEGAREVGRAFENVASTLERELFGKGAGHDIPKPPPPPEAHGERAKVEPVTGETSAEPPDASGERTEPPKP